MTDDAANTLLKKESWPPTPSFFGSVIESFRSFGESTSPPPLEKRRKSVEFAPIAEIKADSYRSEVSEKIMSRTADSPLDDGERGSIIAVLESVEAEEAGGALAV